MNRKVFLIIAWTTAAVLLLCGCSSGSETFDVNERLKELDDFKEWIAQNPTPISDKEALQAFGAFRNVPYGYSKSDVRQIETLAIVEEFDNAIDFEYVDIFGYRMLPTYWFNSAEQFYRGSYYAQTQDDMHDIINNLLSLLSDQYDNALEVNYYDYNNDVITPADNDAARQAVSSSKAYFYAWFSYDVIDVEVYIEVKNPHDLPTKYDVFVNFTDYSYYDYN